MTPAEQTLNTLYAALGLPEYGPMHVGGDLWARATSSLLKHYQQVGEVSLRAEFEAVITALRQMVNEPLATTNTPPPVSPAPEPPSRTGGS